jgi:hypothetical protein
MVLAVPEGGDSAGYEVKITLSLFIVGNPKSFLIIIFRLKLVASIQSSAFSYPSTLFLVLPSSTFHSVSNHFSGFPFTLHSINVFISVFFCY